MPGFLLHVASVKSRPGFSHLEWTPSPSLWQEVGGRAGAVSALWRGKGAGRGLYVHLYLLAVRLPFLVEK